MKKVLCALLLFTAQLNLSIDYNMNDTHDILNKYTFNQWSPTMQLCENFTKELNLYKDLKSKDNAKEISKKARELRLKVKDLCNYIFKNFDSIKLYIQENNLTDILTEYLRVIDNLEIIENAAQDPALCLKSLYNATPCNNQLLIDKFNEIQKDCNIEEKLQLFETKKPDNCKAFYIFYCPAVSIVNQERFLSRDKSQQDFIFYHELRHHLQHTTAQAKAKVQEYERSLHLTTGQAMEYDADMFALEKIAHKNCPYCLQELKHSRYFNFFSNQNYNNQGYITPYAINPYLQKAKENPTICTNHSLKARCHKLLHQLNPSKGIVGAALVSAAFIAKIAHSAELKEKMVYAGIATGIVSYTVFAYLNHIINQIL